MTRLSCPACTFTVDDDALTVEADPYRVGATWVRTRLPRRPPELEMMDHRRIHHPALWRALIAQLAANARARNTNPTDAAHERAQEAGL